MKFASSQQLPGLRAGIARKREETAIIIHRYLEMPQQQIIKFSVKRTNLVCSIVTQSWYRIFILIGFKTTQRKNKIAQETMKRLQKFVQPDQIPSIIRTDNSLEFIRDCEDQCWNHDKSTPYRSEPMELPRTQFPGSQKVHLHLWFSWVIQKSGGEKQWNAYVVGETYKTNWQTESQRMKEDVKLQLMYSESIWS